MKKAISHKVLNIKESGKDKGFDYFNYNVTNRLFNKYKPRHFILTLHDENKNSNKQRLAE